MNKRGFSWIDPRLEVRKTSKYGRGVFANRLIKKDEVLIVMGGYICNTNDENNLGKFATGYNIDLSEEHSFCPLQESDIDLMPQHLVNHSCEPNAGFRDTCFMVAIKDIFSDEEIVYDYAFVMWSSDDSEYHFNLKCLCQTLSCRKIITENDWEIRDIQNKYGEYFQPFLRRRFKQI